MDGIQPYVAPAATLRHQPAAELLVASLSARISPGSNWVVVSLDGTDPARTARQLTALIDVFTQRIKNEAADRGEKPKSFAAENLTKYQRELAAIDAKVLEM